MYGDISCLPSHRFIQSSFSSSHPSILSSLSSIPIYYSVDPQVSYWVLSRGEVSFAWPWFPQLWNNAVLQNKWRQYYPHTCSHWPWKNQTGRTHSAPQPSRSWWESYTPPDPLASNRLGEKKKLPVCIHFHIIPHSSNQLKSRCRIWCQWVKFRTNFLWSRFRDFIWKFCRENVWLICLYSCYVSTKVLMSLCRQEYSASFIYSGKMCWLFVRRNGRLTVCVLPWWRVSWSL